MKSQDFQRLESEVAETNTVSQSATTLIDGFAQRLRDAAEQPDVKASVIAMADELDAKANDLAAAVAANTPAAEEPPVDPEVPPSEGGAASRSRSGR